MKGKYGIFFLETPIQATASLVWFEDPKTLSLRGRFAFSLYVYSVSTPILVLLPTVRLYLAEFRMLYRSSRIKISFCIGKRSNITNVSSEDVDQLLQVGHLDLS